MKSLSDGYTREATRVVNDDGRFRAMLADLDLRMQLRIFDPPDEDDFDYFIRLSPEGAEMARGRLPIPTRL